MANRGAPRQKKLIKIMQMDGMKQLCYQIESEHIRDKKMNEIDDALYFVIDERSNVAKLVRKDFFEQVDSKSVNRFLGLI